MPGTATLAALNMSGGGAAFQHGASKTITGTFPAKSTAAPYIWDDCMGSDPGWSAKWPDTIWNPGNAFQALMDYRTPATVGRGVPTAHSRVTKYLCANSAGEAGGGFGANSMMWKEYTKSDGMTLYASWFERADPSWNHDTDDQNFKYFAISSEAAYVVPYAYFDYKNTNIPASIRSTMNDDSGVGSFFHTHPGAGTPGNGQDICGIDWNDWDGPSGTGSDPFAAAIKREVVCKVSSSDGSCGSPGGFWKYIENGIQFVKSSARTFKGHTDQASGTTRAFGFGGFNRADGQNMSPSTTAGNWRYFNDLYFDLTCVRLVATDDSSYASNYGTSSSSRIVEPQIPTSWSTGSITFTVNLGKLVAATTAYLFVFDNTDVPTLVQSFTVGT